MSDTILHNNLFHDRLRTAAGKLFWLGVVLLSLGIAAVIFPMVSTLVATRSAGAVATRYHTGHGIAGRVGLRFFAAVARRVLHEQQAVAL
jgi:hypothetical protein